MLQGVERLRVLRQLCGYHRALLDGAKAQLIGGVMDWYQCEELKQQAE